MIGYSHVWWPPLASKGHPYTIDNYNNRYRRCCTCDKWFVHKQRWCGVCMRVVYCSTACQTTDWNYHKYMCAHYIGNRVNIVTCARAANRSISYHAAMERPFYEVMFESEEARADMRAEETKHEANRHPWEHLLAPPSQTHSGVAEGLPVAKEKHWSELAWERGLQRGFQRGRPLSSSPI